MNPTSTHDLIAALRAIEPVLNPAVGSTWRVPCLRVLPLAKPDTHVPVVPTPHQDAEVGFPPWHVHLDTRFFSNKDCRLWLRLAHSGTVCRLEAWQTLVFQERVCHRAATIPTDLLCAHLSEAEGNRNSLADPAQNLRCLEAGVCPHKLHRFDQSSVRHGVLHCPLHGLKFRTSDGKKLRCGPKPTA